MPGRRADPALAVVIPCHEGADLLAGCLEALAAQTLERDRFEVLVVETTGRDGAADVVERLARGGLPVRHLHGPDGPAPKRNLGAAQSSAPFLAFTDPDCLPSPGWLAAGLRRLEAGADLVQGRVEPPPGEPPARFGHTIWVTRETGLYEASNVFYSRVAFTAAGGFPTDWFERVGVPFGEDAELGWTVRRAGGRSVFAPDALVHHRVFGADPTAHLREQVRAGNFPELVHAVPELRDTLLTDGIFLGREARWLWLAIGGLLAGRVFRPALLLALPYLNSLAARSSGSRDLTRRATVAGALAASDAVRTAALVRGSVRSRTPVL